MCTISKKNNWRYFEYKNGIVEKVDGRKWKCEMLNKKYDEVSSIWNTIFSSINAVWPM